MDTRNNLFTNGLSIVTILSIFFGGINSANAQSVQTSGSAGVSGSASAGLGAGNGQTIPTESSNLVVPLDGSDPRELGRLVLGEVSYLNLVINGNEWRKLAADGARRDAQKRAEKDSQDFASGITSATDVLLASFGVISTDVGTQVPPEWDARMVSYMAERGCTENGKDKNGVATWTVQGCKTLHEKLVALFDSLTEKADQNSGFFQAAKKIRDDSFDRQSGHSVRMMNLALAALTFALHDIKDSPWKFTQPGVKEIVTKWLSPTMYDKAVEAKKAGSPTFDAHPFVDPSKLDDYNGFHGYVYVKPGQKTEPDHEGMIGKVKDGEIPVGNKKYKVSDVERGDVIITTAKFKHTDGKTGFVLYGYGGTTFILGKQPGMLVDGGIGMGYQSDRPFYIGGEAGVFSGVGLQNPKVHEGKLPMGRKTFGRIALVVQAMPRFTELFGLAAGVKLGLLVGPKNVDPSSGDDQGTGFGIDGKFNLGPRFHLGQQRRFILGLDGTFRAFKTNSEGGVNKAPGDPTADTTSPMGGAGPGVELNLGWRF